MPLYVKDYLAGTSRLTTEQHGAYLLLIMDYWLNGPLPDDDAVLANLTRTSEQRWKQAIKQALSRHFVVSNGTWSHARIDAELDSAKSRRSRAKAGAAGKWGGARAEENKKTRSQRLAEARAKDTHTPSEWKAMKSFCGEQCIRCGSDGPLVKDHIKPIYQGGSDGLDNIQPLCKSCNSSKGPSSTDHRPDGWLDACRMPAKRLLDACTAPAPAHTPIPTSKAKVKSEGAANADPPQKKSKRGSRIPDDSPTQTDLEWSAENFPNVNARKEADKFADYWASVAGQRGVKLDWSAVWRNWIRKSTEFSNSAPTEDPREKLLREMKENRAKQNQGILQ